LLLNVEINCCKKI